MQEHPREPMKSYAVFLIVLGVTLLFYTGAIDSSDAEHTVAMAANIARTGRLDVNAIGAIEAIEATELAIYNGAGQRYSKYGQFTSVVMIPLVWLGDVMPGMNAIATVALLNPLLTALTATVLYHFLRQLRVDGRSALGVALIYGVATPALVYSTTLYREPLVALLLLLAVMSVFYGRALVAGALVALLITTHNVYVVSGAVLGLSLLAQHGIWPTVRYGLVAALGVLITLGFNMAFYGSLFATGYDLSGVEAFNVPAWVGIYGLLFSPYRGIVWYAPMVVLALVGGRACYRQQRGLTLTISGLTLATLGVFASWWSWYGGVVWGPRFLIPLLPLAMIVLAYGLSSRRRWQVAVLFMMIAVAVNGLGLLYHPTIFNNNVLNVRYRSGEQVGYISMLTPEPLWNFAASPIVGHAQMWLNGEPTRITRDVWQALAAMTLIAYGVGLLRWNGRGNPTVERGIQARGIGLAVAACIGIAAYIGQPDVRVTALADALQPPAPTFLYTERYGSAVLDYPIHYPVMALRPPMPTDHRILQQVWARALTFDRLWYVTWLSPIIPESWMEQHLWQHYAFGGARTLDGHRALLFRLRSLAPTTPLGADFGGLVTLDSYTLEVEPDGVILALGWQAQQTPLPPMSFFVHALDANGQIINQQDRTPLGGFAPTDSWQVNQTVIDRLYFPVAGVESVRVGWVGSDGQIIGEFVVLQVGA